MRPFATLAFITLSLSSFVAASPFNAQVVLPNDEVVEDPRWKYSICGTLPYTCCVVCSFAANLKHTGDADDIVQIDSIEVVPDPPEPGKDLTVKVKATTSETIEVSFLHFHTPKIFYRFINRKAHM